MKTRRPEKNETETSVHEAARQLGQRGGISTRDRHGIDFYREIGRKGGQRTKELYGELLSRFGRMGGRPRRPSLEDSAGERNQK